MMISKACKDMVMRAVSLTITMRELGKSTEQINKEILEILEEE